MQHKHFVFSFSNRDLACTAYLNGIPFFTDNVRNQMDPVLRLNRFITPGKNKLELVLTVPPSEMILPEENVSFTGKVECMEGDSQSHTIIELVKIDWTYENIMDFPIHLSFTFDAGLAYGPRVWEQAEPITESNLDRQQLIQYIQRVREALESKTFSVLEPFLNIKHVELSNAFGFPIDEIKNDDKRVFEEMFADPDWGIPEFDTNNLVFDFWAENRILSVLRPNGKEVLRTAKLSSLDIFYSLPLHISRIDNSWCIVA